MYALSDFQVNIQNSSGDDDKLYLEGLHPRFKMTVDWNKSTECMRNAIWQHQVYLYAVNYQPENAIKYLEKVVVDYFAYDKDITLVDDSEFQSWALNLSSVENELILSSKFSIRDYDHSPDQPLAWERIPKFCTMDVFDMYLGFDAIAMDDDLRTIQLLSDKTDLLLIKSYVLHGALISSQNGALCSVNNIAEALLEAEFLFEGEWDLLSFSSQNAIIAAIEKATDIGAVTQAEITNAGSEWDLFISAPFQNRLSSDCTGSSIDDYIVSTAPFMSGSTITNQQGYKNAIDYLREKDNLEQLLSAAWAITVAGKYEYETSTELQWMIDPSIYIHFDKL